MKKLIALFACSLTNPGWAQQRSLTACMAPNPSLEQGQTLSLAKGYATRLYRTIGVDLRWKNTCSPAELEAPGTTLSPNLTTVGIGWALTAPSSLAPGAFAAARPYLSTGTRITVYQDRLARPMQDHNRTAAVLGHVLAHELGHVLLGHSGHARAGLMQPHWSNLDQSAMQYNLLPFSPEDGETIRTRMDLRPTSVD